LTGKHRIFIGYHVDDLLYFTPTALRFDIGIDVRKKAEELFEKEIPNSIVQNKCLSCHIAEGSNQDQALAFVSTSNSDHLEINFLQFESLHEERGTEYIINKSQGFISHGGGVQINSGTTEFLNLLTFLQLLEQIE